jgi:peptidyl-prolyl cis-trans isomerase SurA
MKRNLLSLAVVLFISLVSPRAMAQASDPVLLSVGGENVTKSEFERVYKKNNTKDLAFDRKSIEDYLQLYINYKLKVKEAMELGMDTAQSFKDELGGYRKQLAQPYLVDKDVTESLVKEAYSRLQWDVRASHILIMCAPDAKPQDSLAAYNKIMKIRDEIMKGADFAKEARDKSEDKSAKDNGGDLGYFTALSMVYSFESAAYNAKPGEVTMPVRTRFGYHLIKVTDKRPAMGEVKVAHIMVKVAANAGAEENTNAKNKIDEIYGKLKGGASFEDLAKQYSDDQGSGKNGGVLPPFGAGRMMPEFDKACYDLKNPGDISEPIKTSYGWHIVKLIERKPIGKYEEMQNDLKARVSKDSRSDLSRTSKINSIKAKYQFKQFPKVLDEFMKVIDTTLTEGKWSADAAAKLTKPMFSLTDKNGEKKFTQTDFAKYVESHETRKANALPGAVARNMYNDFINETCMNFEESKLDENFPEFKSLMQEYRDGILLFELTDKKVWTKAVKDSAGLADFYSHNKNNYMWPDRVDAVIYTCADAKVAKDVHALMKKTPDLDPDSLTKIINKDSQLNLQIKSGKFAKGDNETVDGIKWEKGMTKDIVKGTQVMFVDVKDLIPAAPKSLDEAKGLITADYQTFLEKEWIESLRKKYPVTVNQDVVSSLVHK